uniref:uncharacterized protein LOC131135721 isoform X2 n=1 Tax=Doryrhamphus excisus TaxID=161450 RepID=UPI0025ADF471|nr:uncharacterized protein LOC131135721 isoform X2 [Doryrhamphus excisus]
MAWIAAVRRPNITFNTITQDLVVCSRHFHTGRPANEMDESHPDWAPSLHLGHTEVEAGDNQRLHITLDQEDKRLRQQLKARVLVHLEDIQHLMQGDPQPPDIKEEQEDTEARHKAKEEELQHPCMKAEEEEPQPSYLKEEDEELSVTQEGENPLSGSPLTGVSVKTEDHEDKPPESSQLPHSPSEEMREAEPSTDREAGIGSSIHPRPE